MWEEELLTLKTTLADISTTTITHKQSALTFEVFVLWLHNQCYYTCDVIGIKMAYRDLPYYKDIRAKAHHEYKLHKNKHKNHANSLHTFRKWSMTWSQFVVSGCFKCWLIHHSMASTAKYSPRECGVVKHGRPSLDSRSVKKTSRHSF